MYALNAASGEQLWRFETDDEIRSGLVVWNGAVYVNSEKSLYALNAATTEPAPDVKPTTIAAVVKDIKERIRRAPAHYQDFMRLIIRLLEWAYSDEFLRFAAKF